MLHNNQSTEDNLPAAQVRVTAQEVAHATAVLEAKKSAESLHQANTIPLGEAVQQLDLQTTPEELLREIHELRTRRNSLQNANRGTQGLRALFMFSAVFCCYLILALGLRTGHSNSDMPQPASPASLPAVARLTLQSVASAPIGQPMYCDFETLHDLGHGKAMDKVQVVTGAQVPENFWTLRKVGGKVVVESWANLENVLRAENGHSADIYASNSRSSDPNDSRLMRLLPVERFRDAESMHTVGSATDEVTLHAVSSP